MHTTARPTAAGLELGRDTLIHLATDLGTKALAIDPSFWSHTADQAELGDGRILSVFDYTETWSWWERHPVGDEILLLLSGDVELMLDDADGEWSVPLAPGQVAIVPSGAWHRAVVRAPSRLLFITPTPARTEHRDA
jgi:mannose-6-phosphate isomerase-like protein (cupin superfamily)